MRTLSASKRRNAPFILFLHIQKTAGMTMQELLRKHHGPSFLKRGVRYLRQQSTQGLPLREAIARTQPSDGLFVGHFCFGIHRFLGCETRYITFLREPAARLVSLYAYSHTTPEAHYYPIARTRSLEEFLLDTPLLELDNGMTRFIAGDPDDLFINRTPFGTCDHQLLHRAKENLDRHFSFVGIQEQFDASVLLLSRILKWGSACYLTLNVGNKSRPRTQIDPELLAAIRQRNKFDCELYEYGRERFETEFAAFFPDKEAALRAFRDANAKYQKFAYPAYVVRTGVAKFLKINKRKSA